MIETQVIDLRMVNAYLLKLSDGFILIDSGIAPMWKRLERELKNAGCLPGDLTMVLVTHGDMDHSGNCMRLRKKYGTKIAIHPADLAIITDGKPIIREATGLIWKILTRRGNHSSSGNPAFRADFLLQDGQRLDEFGLAAKVIHTPGHTPGSIAILTDDGQLFAGDTIANRRAPALAPLIENKQELLESLEKLKQTHAHIIYPGHGKPFSFEELLKIE
jgi:glyoxylase-like metal-dependent hydrolase (beta-lactamase superfamily II)